MIQIQRNLKFFVTYWGLLGCILIGVLAQAEPKCPELSQVLESAQNWINTKEPIKPEQLKGKVVLLDFWTYCCINCMQIMPQLQALESEFGPKLVVIGVHSGKFDREKDENAVLKAVQRLGISHLVLNDRDFSIWNHCGVNSWPSLVLFDSQGNQAASYSGEGHFEAIRKEIKRHISSVRLSAQNPKVEVQLGQTTAAQVEVETKSGELNFPGKIMMHLGRIFVANTSSHEILGFEESAPRNLSLVERWGEKNQFLRPQGFGFFQDTLFVADTGHHEIASIKRPFGKVVFLGFDKQIRSPWDIAFSSDPEETWGLVALSGDHQIAVLDFKTHKIIQRIGSGEEGLKDTDFNRSNAHAHPDIVNGGDVFVDKARSGSQVQLAQPSSLWFDPDLQSLLRGYFPESERNSLVFLFLDAESSSLRLLGLTRIPAHQRHQGPFRVMVKTLVGKGLFNFGHQDGKNGLLQHPLALVTSKKGMVYIADTYNQKIRTFNLYTQMLGTLPIADLCEPSGLMLHPEREELWISQSCDHRIDAFSLESEKLQKVDLQIEAQLPSLPQLQVKKIVTFYDEEPLVFEFQLPSGSWKWNPQAPSFVYQIMLPQLNLHSTDDQMKYGSNLWKQGQPIITPTFSRRPIRQSHFVGTVYFCSKENASTCQLASFDIDCRLRPRNLFERLFKFFFKNSITIKLSQN